LKVEKRPDVVDVNATPALVGFVAKVNALAEASRINDRIAPASGMPSPRKPRHLLIRWVRRSPTSGVSMHRLFVALACLGLSLALPTTIAAAQDSGRWTVGQPMPSERSEIAAAEVDGRIYAVGGYTGERVVEMYDPMADRWAQGAAFPHPVHHATAVGWQGKLYVFGGYVDDWQPSAGAYGYDPAQDHWRVVPDLPTPRGSPSAAVVEERDERGSDGWQARLRRRAGRPFFPRQVRSAIEAVGSGKNLAS
jgi:hypothetical protein